MWLARPACIDFRIAGAITQPVAMREIRLQPGAPRG